MDSTKCLKAEDYMLSAVKGAELGTNSRSFQALELLWTVTKMLRKNLDLSMLFARNRDGIWSIFDTAADGAWIGWECCA